jgi:hypothetical protein
MFIENTRRIHLTVGFVIFLSLMGCRNNYNQFSSVTEDFQNSVKDKTTLCFYPSTIRMLNFKNDTALNKVFRDIKKIKVVRYNRSSDTTKTINANEWATKIREDKYVDLLRFKQDDRDVMIFLLKHNDDPKKFYGIISDSSQILIIDLVGKIHMKYISQIASGDFNLSGFNSVINYTKPSNSNRNKNNHK